MQNKNNLNSAQKKLGMKKIKLIFAGVFTVLYFATLFLPNRRDVYTWSSGWLNGWRVLGYSLGSIFLTLIVLLLCLFSVFFFKKWTLGLLCCLLVAYALQGVWDTGALLLPVFPMHFGGLNDVFNIWAPLNLLIGLVAIIGWALLAAENLPNSKRKTAWKAVEFKIPLALSGLYLILLIIISRFQFLSTMDYYSLLDWELMPVVVWRLLLIILSILLMCSVFFFRKWSFALSLTLLFTFLYNYLFGIFYLFVPDEITGEIGKASPWSYYLLALLGTVCLSLWVYQFSKTSVQSD